MDIRNENGQNTADAKPLTRHNVYAMVENNRYFGIEEKDGFAPYPAIVPNYLRLYAARINRQKKEKAEAGHRFMFANILPVGLGTVLQTVNIASPYKPEIRFYCENGKIIVDAVRFENAIYDALWMQLRNGSGSHPSSCAKRPRLPPRHGHLSPTASGTTPTIRYTPSVTRISHKAWPIATCTSSKNRAAHSKTAINAALHDKRSEMKRSSLEAHLRGCSALPSKQFY